MGVIKAIKNIFTKPEVADMQSEQLLEWLGISKDNKKPINEITYFTCLKMLSETLGKMSIKLYQETDKGIIKANSNNSYKLLKFRPNPYMTPSTFWATVENNRNHYGNAYVYIERAFQRQKYGGNIIIKNLWIMPSENVQVYIDDAGILGNENAIWYVYTDKYTGEQMVINYQNVLHFKTSLSFDGVLGQPVSEILKATVSGALESQNFANNLYKNGLTAKSVLEYTGSLDEKTKQILIAGIERFASGSENAGRIIPIPLGMKLTPINIKLTDGQFLELKQYTALQIAGAFGIKPNQINNYDKSSYSNSETQQLSFLVDTELFILKQYEEELNFKVLSSLEIDQGLFFKFNEKAILRTDSKSQMECLAKGVNNGIYTPNEARLILNYPLEEGGDRLFMNGNYIPITDVGKQYTKGGETNAQNTTTNE